MAADEFQRGVLCGRDPNNAETVQGGVATTSLRSPWLHQRCGRCDHSFRRGDRVELLASGAVVHTEGTGFCRSDGEATTTAVADEFFAGFVAGCPPRSGKVVRLMPKDPALVRGPFGRKRCAVCGHTLRPYDEVIVCLCQPDAPRCAAMVHHDPVHQMPCTQDWADRAGKRSCPVTAVVLE